MPPLSALASQSSASGLDKIRQSGIDLLKRRDNINLISSDKRDHMFWVLVKFQCWLIFKASFWWENKESVWTTNIFPFVQRCPLLPQPLLLLNRECWWGRGFDTDIKYLTFAKTKECSHCPPDFVHLFLVALCICPGIKFNIRKGSHLCIESHQSGFSCSNLLQYLISFGKDGNDAGSTPSNPPS